MKKILSVLLALSMLSVPVCADTSYTQEQLIETAKKVCSIDDSYTDFEISTASEAYGNVFYSCQWTNESNNSSVEATISSDGIVYSYNCYNSEEPEKNKIYTPEDALKTADSFLRKALKTEYENIEYKSYNNYNDGYTLYYAIKHNNIAYYDTNLRITVNKYSNKITSYYYPYGITGIVNTSFENTKNLNEAEQVMKKSIELGYKANYDYNSEKYNVSLLYRISDYIIKAKDLTPLSNEELYAAERGAGSSDEAAANTASSALTPQEIEGIDDLQNAISVNRALQILNTSFDKALTPDDVNVNYEKRYDRDEYSISINSKSSSNYFNCTIDSEGRVISYYTDNKAEENSENRISEEEALKAANDLMGRFHYGYKTTPVKADDNSLTENSYSFSSNVIRNNYVSFDEYINIRIGNNGEVLSVNARYLPDEIFNININVNITPEQAYSIASDKYPLSPYYCIKYTYSSSDASGEAIPVYGFEEQFSVDANTGELLDYYGDEIINNEVREYTDLDSQWYAEYAINLAYMGYAFDEDEFRGDDPLTYKGLQELNKSRYLGNIDLKEKDENDTITRYEFAEYLIDTMGVKTVSTYNEIYIKPFDDVAYQYTGTIAILKAMGIVGGDSFRGNDNITRGEACAMIYRALVNE